MGWNEPGGNGNKPRDPWGGGGDQGPPDLDEVIRNLKNRFGGIFGGGKKGPGGGGSGSGSGGGSAATVIGIIAIVLVIFGLFSSAFEVDQSQRAVVLRLGKFDRIVGPGLHWRIPLFEDVYKANVTQTKTYTVQQEMLTKDTNIVSVTLQVQYRVVDPKAYLLRVARPETILQHSTESALRQVVGHSTMDDVLKEKREEIRVEVQHRLQEYLDKYNTGLTTVNVALNETAAPKQVQDAFNDVARAREDQDRYEKEAQAYANDVVPRARGRAQRIREQAKGYKQQVVEHAQGDAKRFTDLLVEYKRAPKVTRQRLYLETMQDVMNNTSKVLLDTKNSNNLIYLPLDQIMKHHPKAPSPDDSDNSSSGGSSSGQSGSGNSGSGSGNSSGSGGSSGSSSGSSDNGADYDTGGYSSGSLYTSPNATEVH